MSYRIFSILFLFGTLAADVNPIPARVLVSSSSHLLEVPAFGFYGQAQCDKDGNLFFHTDSNPYNESTVLKLNSSSWEPTIFRVSQDALKSTSFEAFSVTPSGDVWQIGSTKDSAQYVHGFSSDGEMASRTRLEVPDHLYVQDFAVSSRGTILMAGYFDSNADNELQGKPYIGLFDRSGRLLKRLNEQFEKVDFEVETRKVHSGSAAFGDDGFLYLLHEQTILVISESGSVVRRIKFDKPDKESNPTKIAVSGGMAAIWLSNVDNQQQISRRFLVLNLQTQEPLALYTPASDVGKNNALCFSRKDGFEFYGVESGRVKLTHAALR